MKVVAKWQFAYKNVGYNRGDELEMDKVDFEGIYGANVEEVKTKKAAAPRNKAAKSKKTK